MKLIEQAEKNVIRICKDLTDMLSVLDAFSSFGNKFFPAYRPENKQFFDGLQQMRDATYRRYIETLSECFMFVGVGGKDAKAYSIEKFKERFGDKRYHVMDLLDKHGCVAGRYKSEDEETLRSEAKDLMK